MNDIKNYIKIVDGIPFFSKDHYWGKATKEELEKNDKSSLEALDAAYLAYR